MEFKIFALSLYYQNETIDVMELATKKTVSGWNITTTKETVISHKQKSTFKGSRLAKAEQKRVNADTINNLTAKRFESAMTESKASKKRQERKAQREIKKLNKL